MELEGLKRSLTVIKNQGVDIKTLVTDRHSGIKKYMREQEKDIDHRFDCWHMATNISKKIEALAKKKSCAVLGDWKQSISNHLYWCAASSSGDGKQVEAKWLSISNHVTNVHEGHSQAFPRCSHGPLQQERKWLRRGSKAFKELESVISNKTFLKDVPKLSDEHQTSFVEVLHKVDIYFAPKHTHFFYQGMKARLQLAALHFNENANKPQRKIKKGVNAGADQWLVSYPKYKKGGAVAKEIKEACTYDYIKTLFDELLRLRAQFPSYSAALREIKPMLQALPKPLTSQHPQQDKQAVVTKHKSRFNK
ncbi:uncharacterized protein [Montipora capricornis]|uniref:uncharacterized protein n=1 Tax=Montipora capricornis TaxID=246305 RepID=UPI0035F18C6A